MDRLPKLEVDSDFICHLSGEPWSSISFSLHALTPFKGAIYFSFIGSDAIFNPHIHQTLHL
jgi:hypothetical protein